MASEFLDYLVHSVKPGDITIANEVVEVFDGVLNRIALKL
jgi:hypothetical protein